MDIAANEDPLEVLNWHLRRAMELLDEGRNSEAVWGPSKPPAEVVKAITLARRYLDDAERGAVVLMREGGASWTEVGEQLGVTKQAAQARFRSAAIWRDAPKAYRG
jgi:hypothetical protein